MFHGCMYIEVSFNASNANMLFDNDKWIRWTSSSIYMAVKGI